MLTVNDADSIAALVKLWKTKSPNPEYQYQVKLNMYYTWPLLAYTLERN